MSSKPLISGGAIQQNGPLFDLPLEVRRLIWEQAFFAMAGTQTLKPQRILPYDESDDEAHIDEDYVQIVVTSLPFSPPANRLERK